MKRAGHKAIIGLLALTTLGSAAFSSTGTAMAKTQIRYFFWAATDELKLRQQMITMFEKANPDIKVKAEWCDPGSFDTKLIAMCAAGMAPDVVNMCNDWHGKRIPLWLPLDSYVQKEKTWRKEDFYPVTINTLSKKGSLYSVPYIVKSATFFYNSDLISQLGLPIPTDNWSWNDMLQIATKGSSGTGAQRRFGLGGLNDIHAAWAFGGKLFNDDMTKSIAANPQVEKGLNFALDLINKYQAMPNSRGTDIGRFSGAKSPIVQGYSWDIMGLQKVIKKKFNWDLVGMPQDDEGNRSADVRVDGLAIMKSAKNKDAAWRFLKYFSGNREVQDYVGAQEGIPPLKVAAMSENFYTNFPAGQSYNRKYLSNSLNYGKVQPFGGYFGPIADVWGKEIGDAYSRKRSVTEALKRFETQANVIFNTPGRLH